MAVLRAPRTTALALTLAVAILFLAARSSEGRGSRYLLAKGDGKIGLELWFNGTSGNHTAQQTAAKFGVSSYLAIKLANIKKVKELDLPLIEGFKIVQTLLGFPDVPTAVAFNTAFLDPVTALPGLAGAIQDTGAFVGTPLVKIVSIASAV